MMSILVHGTQPAVAEVLTVEPVVTNGYKRTPIIIYNFFVKLRDKYCNKFEELIIFDRANRSYRKTPPRLQIDSSI